MTAILSVILPGFVEKEPIVVGFQYAPRSLTVAVCLDVEGAGLWLDITRNDLEEGMESPELSIRHDEKIVSLLLPGPNITVKMASGSVRNFLALTYTQYPKDAEFQIDDEEIHALLGD